MSRMKPVKSARSPGSASTPVIDSSIGKVLPSRAQRGQLEPLAEQPRLGALRDAPERRPVGIAEPLGDDQRRHLLAEHLLRR